MSKFVMDASAITAVIRGEDGSENVIPHLRGSLISSINLAEVFCNSRSNQSDPEMDEAAIRTMELETVPFNDQQAMILASIYPQTLGSSVGIADRACMSLAILNDLPIITGDRAWRSHEIGVEIILFRS